MKKNIAVMSIQRQRHRELFDLLEKTGFMLNFYEGVPAAHTDELLSLAPGLFIVDSSEEDFAYLPGVLHYLRFHKKPFRVLNIFSRSYYFTEEELKGSCIDLSTPIPYMPDVVAMVAAHLYRYRAAGSCNILEVIRPEVVEIVDRLAPYGIMFKTKGYGALIDLYMDQFSTMLGMNTGRSSQKDFYERDIRYFLKEAYGRFKNLPQEMVPSVFRGDRVPTIRDTLQYISREMLKSCAGLISDCMDREEEYVHA